MAEGNASIGSDKLSAVTCPKCGAPFPQDAFMLSRITCVHCGGRFQREQLAPPRPVVLDGAATGQVVIGGHVVGGSMGPEAAPSAEPAGDHRTGGVTIRAGRIHIGGDVVGGDKVVERRPGWGARLESFFRRVWRAIRRSR